MRNLARHRRRTVVNALSVAVTTAILAFSMGYYRGSYAELLYSTIIDYQTAHAQVQAAPRLLLAGFAGDGTEKLPLLIVGAEPEAERTVGVAQRSLDRRRR